MITGFTGREASIRQKLMGMSLFASSGALALASASL